jgi:hypothetical protein
MTSIISFLASSLFFTCFGFLIGFILVVYYYHHNDSKDFTPIVKLKNALLTLAIINVSPEDMEHNFNYSTYDGSKYPALSGSSIGNACFTYIFNMLYFKKSTFYTEQYASKLTAIEKYLENKLNTEEQILSFFEKVRGKYITKDDKKDDKKYD